MPFAKFDQLNLYYEVQGQGPRLVFHPGTASDLRIQPSIFESPLAKHFEILSFDPRGIGQSNSPDDAPTMADYANDMKKLMTHLGWNNAHILGESFGGMVAQEFALQFNEHVNKLVLIVTSSGGAGGSSYPFHEHDLSGMNNTEKAHFWIKCGDSRASDNTWRETHSTEYKKQFDYYFKAFELSDLTPDNIHCKQRQIHARKGHDTYERLPQISKETYICAGRYDNTAPLNNQLALLKQIHGSHLSLFDGSHMVLWQDPLAFQSIITFLTGRH